MFQKYQIKPSEWLIKNKGLLCCYSTGTGKTRVSLHVANELLKHTVDRILFILPAPLVNAGNISKEMIQLESNGYSFLKPFDPNDKCSQPFGNVCSISHESFLSQMKQIVKDVEDGYKESKTRIKNNKPLIDTFMHSVLFGKDKYLIIIDEAHVMSHALESNIQSVSSSLLFVCTAAYRVLLLTATPIRNSLKDLIPLLVACTPGKFQYTPNLILDYKVGKLESKCEITIPEMELDEFMKLPHNKIYGLKYIIYKKEKQLRPTKYAIFASALRMKNGLYSYPKYFNTYTFDQIKKELIHIHEVYKQVTIEEFQIHYSYLLHNGEQYPTTKAWLYLLFDYEYNIVKDNFTKLVHQYETDPSIFKSINSKEDILNDIKKSVNGKIIMYRPKEDDIHFAPVRFASAEIKVGKPSITYKDTYFDKQLKPTTINVYFTTDEQYKYDKLMLENIPKDSVNAYLNISRRLCNTPRKIQACIDAIELSNKKDSIIIYSTWIEFGLSIVMNKLLKDSYKNISLDPVTNNPAKSFAVIDGTTKNKGQILQAYNSGVFKIILISEAGGTGLDFRGNDGVRQVHILDPVWNDATLQQIIGRARRRDAHINDPKATIDVYLYQCIYPKIITADGILYNLMIQKKSCFDFIMNTISESSMEVFQQS